MIHGAPIVRSAATFVALERIPDEAIQILADVETGSLAARQDHRVSAKR